MPKLLTKMSHVGSAFTRTLQPAAVPRSAATPRTLCCRCRGLHCGYGPPYCGLRTSVNHNRRSATSETAGNGKADTLRGAGDDSSFTGKLDIHGNTSSSTWACLNPAARSVCQSCAVDAKSLPYCMVKSALDSCFRKPCRARPDLPKIMSARAALRLLAFTFDTPLESWFSCFRKTGSDAGRYRNSNWEPELQHVHRPIIYR